MSLSDEERPMFEYSSNPLNLQVIIPAIPTKKVSEAVKKIKHRMFAHLLEKGGISTTVMERIIDEEMGSKLI